MAKLVAGLFPNLEAAKATVRDLTEGGFPQNDISLITKDESGRFVNSENIKSQIIGEESTVDAAQDAGKGAVIGGLAGLVIGLIALAIPGIGPIIAAGPIALALGGAGVGAVTGGLVGAFQNAGVPENFARLYAEGVRRGGTVVLVSTAPDMVDRAVTIINKHDPIDLDKPELQKETDDLIGYDENAASLPPEALAREQFHYAERLGKKGEPEESFIQRESEGGGSQVPDNPNETTVGEPINPNQPEAPAEQVRGFDEFEPTFREHFTETYSGTGYSYQDYRPAYIYGYFLAINPNYDDLPWPDLEPFARQEWERQHPDQNWSDYLAAVYKGWDAVSRHA